MGEPVPVGDRVYGNSELSAQESILTKTNDKRPPQVSYNHVTSPCIRTLNVAPHSPFKLLVHKIKDVILQARKAPRHNLLQSHGSTDEESK